MPKILWLLSSAFFAWPWSTVLKHASAFFGLQLLCLLNISSGLTVNQKTKHTSYFATYIKLSAFCTEYQFFGEFHLQGSLGSHRVVDHHLPLLCTIKADKNNGTYWGRNRFLEKVLPFVYIRESDDVIIIWKKRLRNCGAVLGHYSAEHSNEFSKLMDLEVNDNQL